MSVDSDLRLAYLVARFPKTTETFIARELNAVSAQPGLDVRLFSLFRSSRGTTVHVSAEPWVTRVTRPTPAEVATSLCLSWLRRPVVMTSTFAILVSAFWRSPAKLVRSLAVAGLATAHARRMQRSGIEHVHAHFVGHAATAAWVVMRLTGIGYSTTAHAYELFQDSEFLERRVRDARFVVTISNYNAAFIRERCGDRSPIIHVVHAGVDLGRYAFRPRVLPSHGPIQALAVGSMIKHKGHDVLLAALAVRDAELERVTLTIVGDGPERANLCRQIDRLGLADRVQLPGSLSESEVARLLDQAQLFVMSSLISSTGRMEGIPVALMEALSAGVPAVATRLSGIPELIEDGVTGTLAEQGDVESLREAIRSVLRNPARATEMARSGRERVERDFDVNRSAEALAAQFRRARPG